MFFFNLTTTGVAPDIITEFIVAINVRFGTITSSPLPILNAFNAINKPFVQLWVIEYVAPNFLTKLFSNFLVSWDSVRNVFLQFS